jgi:hypothetical protein
MHRSEVEHDEAFETHKKEAGQWHFIAVAAWLGADGSGS